jgi:hypothetical protein
LPHPYDGIDAFEITTGLIPRNPKTGSSQIKVDWIKSVIENPEKVEIQSDGRIRKWANIPETGKYLRVILLEDGETVHNAFFDRSYKEA